MCQISSLYHVLPSPSPIPAVSTCSLLHSHNRTVVGSHRRTGFSTGCDYSLSQCSPSHPCSSMTMVFFYNSRSCKKTGRHSHSVWCRPRFLPISFRDQRFHPVPQQSTRRGFASYGGVVSGGTMAGMSTFGPRLVPQLVSIHTYERTNCKYKPPTTTRKKVYISFPRPSLPRAAGHHRSI
jgi:hypothetical protein